MLINELKNILIRFISTRQEEIVQALLDGEDTPRYFAYRNREKPMLSINRVFNGWDGP